MNPTELFFAILVGALAMVTPALMLLRAAALYGDDCDNYAPPTPVTPVTVVNQSIHVHYHVQRRPACYVTPLLLDDLDDLDDLSDYEDLEDCEA
jgi:hypothetical protein